MSYVSNMPVQESIATSYVAGCWFVILIYDLEFLYIHMNPLEKKMNHNCI
jgi:hypothetical protein